MVTCFFCSGRPPFFRENGFKKDLDTPHSIEVSSWGGPVPQGFISIEWVGPRTRRGIKYTFGINWRFSVWFGTMWPSWHLVRQHLIVMAGFWPWSDSMTGTSIARLQRHYLVLTVQSCPGLITCFVLEACTWHELTYSFSQFFLEACTYMGLMCSFFLRLKTYIWRFSVWFGTM